jgi:hypothetical protein
MTQLEVFSLVVKLDELQQSKLHFAQAQIANLCNQIGHVDRLQGPTANRDIVTGNVHA